MNAALKTIREMEVMGNVPFFTGALRGTLSGVKATDKKLLSMERQGDVIRLKRGIYVLSPDVSGKELSLPLIANHLRGPSYVSCLSALSHYGLIPERVCTTQSMTLKRSKIIDNKAGRFEYFHCSEDYFPIGICSEVSAGVAYLIASPEKALCDLIVTTPYLNLRYMRELVEYLEEDIRLDMDDFVKFDKSVFEECAKVGKKKVMMENIVKLLEKWQAQNLNKD